MPAKAYVLIETVVGESRQAAHALRLLSGIESAAVVAGPHDIIAVAEAPDLHAIGELITRHVHSVKGIIRTVTCLSVGD